MIRRVVVAALGAAAVTAATAWPSAAQPVAYERAGIASGAGPHKLPVDGPLLTGARPFDQVIVEDERVAARGGPSDLRFVDEPGQEVPYLLVLPSRKRQPSEPAAPHEPVAPGRGARVDPSAFRYQRVIPEGPGGLVALQLDAAVLAHSRGPAASFADVRIIDEEGHQIPYLTERRPEPLSVDLSVGPATPRVRELRGNGNANRSVHAIRLPYPNLPDPRIVLETSDRVFRRALQIGVERQPDRRRREIWFEVLAVVTWQHADPDAAAPPLEIPVHPRDAAELLLVVDEGDNRPLALTSARLRLPRWRLRFFRPSGPIRVIYGNQDAKAPEYDLSLLAPAVMGGEVKDVFAGPEEPPASVPPASLSPRVFWSGLALAVLVLIGLIARLIVSATPPPPARPGP